MLGLIPAKWAGANVSAWAAYVPICVAIWESGIYFKGFPAWSRISASPSWEVGTSAITTSLAWSPGPDVGEGGGVILWNPACYAIWSSISSCWTCSLRRKSWIGWRSPACRSPSIPPATSGIISCRAGEIPSYSRETRIGGSPACNSLSWTPIWLGPSRLPGVPCNPKSANSVAVVVTPTALIVSLSLFAPTGGRVILPCSIPSITSYTICLRAACSNPQVVLGTSAPPSKSPWPESSSPRISTCGDLAPRRSPSGIDASSSPSWGPAISPCVGALIAYDSLRWALDSPDFTTIHNNTQILKVTPSRLGRHACRLVLLCLAPKPL